MYFNANTMQKKLITDIKGLPINLQKVIADKIKTAEAKILVQMEINPDGLNDYLNAELKSAITQMQRLIQESQMDGAELITISKWYVSYKEYAKKLNEYKRLINDGKTSNEPDTPIKPPEPLETILNKVVEKGFAKKNGSHYKWLKPQSYLAVFADVLNEKGYTKNKFSEIETLFGVKRLAQTLCRTLDQKNEPEIRAKIKMLFN
jgi:hypothetical protein